MPARLPRSGRIAAGAVVAGLGLLIVAAIVVGLVSGQAPVRPSSTPGIAAGSGSPLPAASALVLAPAATLASATPVATPTPETPDDGVSPRVPDVMARIPCAADDTTPVTSGGRLYVSCGAGASIVAIDLATDKVVQTYTPDDPEAGQDFGPDLMFVDGGLWLGFDDGVQRLDLSSGARTANFPDYDLLADQSGSLWLRDGDDNLFKVDPATTRKSAWDAPNVADAFGFYPDVACGMVWVTGQLTSDLTRVDPVTDVETDMGDAGVPAGIYSDVIQIGDTCWAVIDTDASSVLARLGPSCADMVTSDIGHEPYVLGDTVWEMSDDGSYIAQVEPFGGKTGRHWLVSADDIGWLVSADGQVWISTDTDVERLNIPLDKMTPGPTPKTRPCAAAAASPSPSAGATATPTATATAPTATPTPAPTPTPTPSSTDSAGASPSTE